MNRLIAESLDRVYIYIYIYIVCLLNNKKENNIIKIYEKTVIKA